MPASAVVSDAPAKDLVPALQRIYKDFPFSEDFFFIVELKDSASALSALVPTAPIDWGTPNSVQRIPNAEEVHTVSSTGRCNTGLLK